MFNFLAKNKGLSYFAPSSGTLTMLTELDDPVFSQKMMGDGFAVEPNESVVTAPVNGVISTIFPTKHAIGIRTKSGEEVLVHIGIDTVALEGKPFHVKVEVGDKVTSKSILAVVDLEMLKEMNKPSTIIVVFTNRPSIEDFASLEKINVNSGDKLGELID